MTAKSMMIFISLKVTEVGGVVFLPYGVGVLLSKYRLFDVVPYDEGFLYYICTWGWGLLCGTAIGGVLPIVCAVLVMAIMCVPDWIKANARLAKQLAGEAGDESKF